MNLKFFFLPHAPVGIAPGLVPEHTEQQRKERYSPIISAIYGPNNQHNSPVSKSTVAAFQL